MAIKFTDDQKDVIKHKGDNLLVFASAGSGKTAVIIEKIATDIISGEVKVDNLLVVTFTEAATAEMKQRLYDKLAEKIDEPNVIKEIEKLPLANISTLHGFCQKLIKQYFFELGIDPSFRILDDSESNYYKIKVLDDIFRQKQDEDDKDFFDLCEKFYTGRNLNSLKDSLLEFYDFLQALDDKNAYLENIALSSYVQDLNQNPVCQYMAEKYSKSYFYFRKAFEKLSLEAEMAGEAKECTAINKMAECFNVSINSFESCYTAYHAFDSVRSSLGLKSDSTILARARLLWEKGFSKEKEKFFDSCGGKDMSLEDISKALHIARQSIGMFIDLVKLFEQEYSKSKHSLNALDFDDLEKYALILLNNKTISQDIQNQFVNIYVDEYQDINSKQEKILSLITQGNNMIMVGDIKQSIYGFRNSTPQIFIDKSKAYKNEKGGKLIKLNENFRSNPIILDFVNKIFINVMKDDFGGVDYAVDGSFVGSAKYEKVEDYKEVSLHLINTKERKVQERVEAKIYSVQNDDRQESAKSTARLEAAVVAEKIKAMRKAPYYDAKEKVFKSLDFRNFNILCRSREYIKELAFYLRALGVPVDAKTKQDIYNNPDCLLFVNILKVINNPKDDIALTAVLLSPFFDISYDELLEVRKNNASPYFYEALEAIDNTSDIGKKLNNVFTFIETLREQKDFCTIYELLTIASRKLGILNYYLLLPNGRVRYELARDFIESFNGMPYNNSIPEYLAYVESYLKDADVAMNFAVEENSVTIDTIHSSKGLEYEVVFVCGCGKPFSNVSLTSRVLKNKTLGIGFNAFDTETFIQKETIARKAISAKIKEEERLEEVRLLYVALTRAKNSLNIISCLDTEKVSYPSEYEITNANKYITWILSALPKPLVDNIALCDDTKTMTRDEAYEVCVYQEGTLIQEIEKQKEDFAFCIDQTLAKDIKEYIDRVYPFAESTKIAQKNTVTGIMSMQEETESYNFEPKKLTTAESHKFDFDYAKLGSIYHALMEELNFDSDLQKIKEYIENKKAQNTEDEKYYNQINPQEILTCFETFRPIIKNKQVSKEKQFIAYLPYNDIVGGNTEDKVLLQGIIDLLVDNGDSLDIYDYKTTKVNNVEQLVEKYAVQMKLYKLATERAVGKKVKNVFIYSFCLNSLVKIL